MYFYAGRSTALIQTFVDVFPIKVTLDINLKSDLRDDGTN